MRYICQATQLPYFTTPLAWWDIRQYVEDYVSGNVTLRRIFAVSPTSAITIYWQRGEIK